MKESQKPEQASFEKRNRIFHHESISWNIEALQNYRNEIVEGIDWLDKDLVNWCEDLMHINQTIEENRLLIK